MTQFSSLSHFKKYFSQNLGGFLLILFFMYGHLEWASISTNSMCWRKCLLINLKDAKQCLLGECYEKLKFMGKYFIMRYEFYHLINATSAFPIIFRIWHHSVLSLKNQIRMVTCFKKLRNKNIQLIHYSLWKLLAIHFH